MSSLADKIRASRVLTIQVGDMKFFARRPSIEEFGEIYSEGVKDPALARRFVTGWENVRECDLLPGGSQELVQFSAEVWGEAVADMPHVWREICTTLTRATTEYLNRGVDDRKN